jgi:hypothetical protein
MEENQVDPNAPAPAPAPKQEEKKAAPAAAPEGLASTFFEKLKEQSFTILVMCGVLYYQHTLWMADKDALTKEVDVKEERILQLVEREHSHTLEREAALREKRDQFVEMLKSEAAACRGSAR